MSDPKIYVNAIGVEILVDVGSDIRTATKIRLNVKKPNGVNVIWSATLNPPDGYNKRQILKHVTVSGDLDIPGWYTVMAYVEIPSFRGYGAAVKFQVYSLYE